jgi:hypothetical protein
MYLQLWSFIFFGGGGGGGVGERYKYQWWTGEVARSWTYPDTSQTVAQPIGWVTNFKGVRVSSNRFTNTQTTPYTIR